MLVLRQKRSVPYSAGHAHRVVAEAVDREDRAGERVLGRPPSDGGLKRGSRQVPVHAGLGSIFALACVSL